MQGMGRRARTCIVDYSCAAPVRSQGHASMQPAPHGLGGVIFYIEIENDAPFENVEALIKAVWKYR